MSMKKIKVLQIMNGAAAGGISTVILNYYSVIDRNRIHFDCAMPDIDLGPNGLALSNLGCKIIQLPLKSKKPIKYWIILNKILKDGKYDAIHVNGNITSFYPLLIAKCAGIPVRIAHAHTAMLAKMYKDKIKRCLSSITTKLVATKIVACTNESAVATFGKNCINSDKFVLLNNSINTDKFAYNQNVRNQLRKKLNLTDKFVIGCVGNLGPEKNHTFALKICKEAILQNKFVHLFIVGDGKLKDKLIEESRLLGISDSVSFLGRRTDINELLQAMDVFLMPSLYEGFSLAALEAATAGLPIFFSDNIPKNFSFYSECYYISLNKSPKEWAEFILRKGTDINRKLGLNKVKEAGYDIIQNAEVFESLYIK